MEPIHITSKSDLIQKINLYTDKLLIFMFTASWCNPCKNIKKIIHNETDNTGLAIENNHVVFFYIDVDINEELTNEFNINSMPTFILHRVGNDNKLRVVNTFKGADKNKLIAAINEY